MDFALLLASDGDLVPAVRALAEPNDAEVWLVVIGAVSAALTLVAIIFAAASSTSSARAAGIAVESLRAQGRVALAPALAQTASEYLVALHELHEDVQFGTTRESAETLLAKAEGAATSLMLLVPSYADADAVKVVRNKVSSWRKELFDLPEGTFAGVTPDISEADDFLVSIQSWMDDIGHLMRELIHQKPADI